MNKEVNIVLCMNARVWAHSPVWQLLLKALVSLHQSEPTVGCILPNNAQLVCANLL